MPARRHAPRTNAHLRRHPPQVWRAGGTLLLVKAAGAQLQWLAAPTQQAQQAGAQQQQPQPQPALLALGSSSEAEADALATACELAAAAAAAAKVGGTGLSCPGIGSRVAAQ
jgi:hypothetical protein